MTCFVSSQHLAFIYPSIQITRTEKMAAEVEWLVADQAESSNCA